MLVVAALGCSDAGTSLTGPKPDQPTDTPQGNTAFFGGVYLGDDVTTPERVATSIHAHSAQVGRHPALVKSFHHLAADLSPAGWSGRVLHEIQRAGSTNYVALDLDWPGRPAGALLYAITSGAADAKLTLAAKSIAQVNGIVLVEPAWEMNGNWNYAWQGVANGGNGSAPAQYVAAWRRMVQIFRENGATNVRWVFNPNTGNALAAGSPGAAHWNWYANYYPGDAYVDYVGAHGYNGPSVWGHAYKTFNDVFYGVDSDNMLVDMAQRYADKPMIIGEMATQEVAGHDKGAWITAAYQRMRSDPRVVGAIWFDTNKEADWRIDSSASSLRAYQQAMMANGVLARFDDAVGRTAVLAAR